MAVVRLGPLPLASRRATRTAELERIFGTAVQVVEVVTVADLVTAVAHGSPVGIALDVPPPGQLAEAVAAAGRLPVLRPLWRQQRKHAWFIDEVFDGYGLLSGTEIVSLADGELGTT